MNKKLIALAVAGAFAGYGSAATAASATISGFADIIYTLADDANGPVAGSGGKNTTEGKFAADAEIDAVATMGAVTTRVDVDFDMASNGGSNSAAGQDSGRIEQAFFAWDLAPVTLIGGIFNSPLGADAEDAPDMDFTTHSVVYNILDHQTVRDGYNVTGLAIAGDVGPVTLTGAFLNDHGGANEENSLALVANFSPMPDLDLELGMVTLDDQATAGGVATTAGDWIDFNVTYSVQGFTVGLDYLSPDNVIDSAYTIWGGYTHGDFNVKLRTETVEWATPAGGVAPADHEANTLYGSYAANENLSIALEYKDGDQGAATAPGNTAHAITGVSQDDLITLEFIATF